MAEPKQYFLTREDGTKESVMLEDHPDRKKQAIRENIIAAYFIIGTLVMSLTLYLTLKKMK